LFGTVSGTFVLLDHLQQSLKRVVLDQTFAEFGTVAHEVAQGPRRIGTRLLFFVLEQRYYVGNARLQLVVERVIVESGIAHRETGELPSVFVYVFAALHCQRNQAMVGYLGLELVTVSADVAD